MTCLESLEQVDHWVSIGAGLATMIASGAAIWGIAAWRHQLRGTSEYRAALRCYKAIVRLRDRANATRRPLNHMVPTYEHENSADTPEFVERERQHYWTFFREVLRAALALQSLRPEAEIFWGAEATNHIDTLDQLTRRLNGGYQAYFQHRMKAVSGQPEYAKYAAGARSTVFNLKLTDDDQDAFGEALDSAVTAALAFFKSRAGLV